MTSLSAGVTPSSSSALCSPNAGVLMPTVQLSEPLFAVAISPKQRLDEAKLSQALARLIDEDPALHVARAEFTNELQLLGSGETHVATATERLARKYNVDVKTHPPSIAYREIAERTVAGGVASSSASDASMPSATCPRTSWTTTPAVRPTARMARAANRNGIVTVYGWPVSGFDVI